MFSACESDDHAIIEIQLRSYQRRAVMDSIALVCACKRGSVGTAWLLTRARVAFICAAGSSLSEEQSAMARILDDLRSKMVAFLRGTRLCSPVSLLATAPHIRKIVTELVFDLDFNETSQ
jgi:hypothetical protein